MAWSRAPRVSNQSTNIYPFLFVAGLAVVCIITAQQYSSPTTTNGIAENEPAKKYPSTAQTVEKNTAQTVPKSEHTNQWATFQASRHYKDGKYHLLLAATGSVATIKIPNICEALSKYNNLSVRVLLSESATKFLAGQSEEQPRWSTLKQIKNVDGVYVDRHEWDKPWIRGDNILHIELRRWADLMVIAPLSANGLAKLAMGMSDSLVMSVARAWDTTGQIDGLRPGIKLQGGARKTIMVAPAMNTAMWRHPATLKHLNVLVGEWGVKSGGWIELLSPIEKGLACGDAGSGGMREWKAIVGDIERKFPRLRTNDTEHVGGVRIEDR